MAALDRTDPRVVALLAVVGVVTFLYSVLVVAQVLLWFVGVVLLGILYFGWRFVRAVERIADALETRE